MGFYFISVHKNIHHGFNHSEVNSSYSVLLMHLHKTNCSWIQTSKHWLSVAWQQDLPRGGMKPINVSQ